MRHHPKAYTGDAVLRWPSVVKAVDKRTRTARVEHEYAQLVERHRDEFHAHSRRILHSPEDAEDALQEALVRAGEHCPGSRAELAAKLAAPDRHQHLDG